MHERCALKSMSGPFASQKCLGQTTQVFINLRHHLANRGGLVAPDDALHAQQAESTVPRETPWAHRREPLP